MHLTEEGDGFPVVLIHGFCETMSIWDTLTSSLIKNYKVIRIDLPGFGNSSLQATPITLNEIARQVQDTLSKKGIEQYVVIGHSLGGYVTLALEDLFPGSIKAFGLFHSTAFADSDQKKEGRNQAIRVVESKGAGVFLNNFYQNLFHQPLTDIINSLKLENQNTPGESIIAYSEAMRDRPERTHLLKTEKPKFIIAGKHDGAVPYADSQKLFELANNCINVILEESGHMGMIEEAEKSNASIRNFLNKVI